MLLFVSFGWKNNKENFVLILLLIALATYAFFAENGERYVDGNFGWGYAICGLIFQTVSMINLYTIQIDNVKPWKKYLFVFVWFIYLAHVYSGVNYLYRMFYGLLGGMNI